MTKDQEIAKVAARLDALLDDLHVSVEALAAILVRPKAQGSDDERLKAP